MYIYFYRGRRNTGLSNRMMGDKRTPTKNPKDLQPLADSSSPVIGSQNNSQAPVNNRQQVVVSIHLDVLL